MTTEQQNLNSTQTSKETIDTSQNQTFARDLIDTDTVTQIIDEDKKFLTILFTEHASAYYLLKDSSNFSTMHDIAIKSRDNKQKVDFVIDFSNTEIFPSIKTLTLSLGSSTVIKPASS